MSRHKNYKYKCKGCSHWRVHSGMALYTLRPTEGYCLFYNNPRHSNQHGCINYTSY